MKKSTLALGCRTGPLCYIGWSAGTTIIFAGVNSPGQGLWIWLHDCCEFGIWQPDALTTWPHLKRVIILENLYFIQHCFICQPAYILMRRRILGLNQDAKFLVTDSGKQGLSYRPASLFTATLYARVDYIPQSGTKNFARGLLRLWHWQWNALTTRLDLIHINIWQMVLKSCIPPPPS